MAAPLSAIGSVLGGGRYNEIGIEVLYLADTQHTTLFETNSVYNHSGKIAGRKNLRASCYRSTSICNRSLT